MKEKDYIEIIKNDLHYDKTFCFRELEVYKNPVHGKETENISQAKIIGAIINEVERAERGENVNDIFVTAMTGFGKSIIYQTAAVCIAKKYQKMTVVVEPIKALMKDQVESLKKRGYERAVAINSDNSYYEGQEALRKIKNNEVDIVYISPEMLLLNPVEKLFADRSIGLFVCDESHVVTLWGKAFRPDYWYLGEYLKRIRAKTRFVICSFTATAVYGGDSDAVGEIIESLYMQNPTIILGVVKRNDISFDIRKKESNKLEDKEYDERKAIDMALQMNGWAASNKKGLVYMPYAKHVESVYYAIRNFSRKKYPIDKIGIYCGKKFDKISAEEFNLIKEDSFNQFRMGSRRSCKK